MACDEQSNEITAIPEALAMLSFKGCTVTIDAMGCQKEIASEIRRQKGHYVLQVKGNQPTLEADLVDFFGEQLESEFAGARHTVHESTETGHGRTETRIVHALSLPKDFVHRDDWPDLKTLVAVTSGRDLGGEESWDSRYYITDHPPRAKSLGHAIRRHWGIENSQHWVLDVTFGEDARRQQDRRGATNLPPCVGWRRACCVRRRRSNAARKTNDSNAPSTQATCSESSRNPRFDAPALGQSPKQVAMFQMPVSAGHGAQLARTTGVRPPADERRMPPRHGYCRDDIHRPRVSCAWDAAHVIRTDDVAAALLLADRRESRCDRLSNESASPNIT